MVERRLAVFSEDGRKAIQEYLETLGMSQR